jgi:tetratricopeptide (TPR) repeat protein
MLASARRAAGDPSGAAEAARQALQLDAEDTEARLELALALEDSGCIDEAESALISLAASELAALAMQRRGRLHLFHHNDASRAEALLEESFQCPPEATTLYSHAEAREHLGKLAQAADAAGELLNGDLAPTAEILGYTGDLFRRLGDRASAERALLAALSRDPSNTYALRSYCIALAEEGKLRQARDVAGRIPRREDRADLLAWVTQLESGGGVPPRPAPHGPE